MFQKKHPLTVDAAIAPLLQAIDDLAGVMAIRTANLESNRNLITSLEICMKDDQAELDRASAVSKMIKSITNLTGAKPHAMPL